MTGPIHDHEPDTGETVVRTLLAAECPCWAGRPLDHLQTSGTSNAMWRVRLDSGPDVVVRLPRHAVAAAEVEQEVVVLERVGRFLGRLTVSTPSVRHVGRSHEIYPYAWSVLEWLDGADAWEARDRLTGAALASLARDLGRVVNALAEVSTDGLEPRAAGARGGPLRPLLDRLDRWLDDPRWEAHHHLDVAAVRRCAAEASEIADEPVPETFVHGDLLPGNLLVTSNSLTAVLDWGGAGRGDPAQDLAPAWSVLTAAERPLFRSITGADDMAWLRARTFELEHAVGGVLYYRPRGHPLGDVMARTLDRLLA